MVRNSNLRALFKTGKQYAQVRTSAQSSGPMKMPIENYRVTHWLLPLWRLINEFACVRQLFNVPGFLFDYRVYASDCVIIAKVTFVFRLLIEMHKVLNEHEIGETKAI